MLLGIKFLNLKCLVGDSTRTSAPGWVQVTMLESLAVKTATYTRTQVIKGDTDSLVRLGVFEAATATYTSRRLLA